MISSDFRLTFAIPQHEIIWSFDQSLIFLGSCFSDEMSNKAKLHGLNVLANPFGTIFHPIPLAQNILDALSENQEVDSLNHQDLWFDWGSSGQVFGYSEAELVENVRQKRSILREKLAKCTVLYVTFGSAFGYFRQNQIVANCHKQPSQTFHKRLSTVEELVGVWKEVIEKMKVYNPRLKLVFTVSPVRHWRDGMIENNRSKARLLLLCESLSTLEDCTYFPAYELLNDDLRDYRFFQGDKVHPSEEAVEYIWEKLLCSHSTESSRKILETTAQLKVRRNHRLLYPESKAAKDFQSQTTELIQAWKQQFPNCDLG
jgi:hypothetical protein